MPRSHPRGNLRRRRPPHIPSTWIDVEWSPGLRDLLADISGTARLSGSVAADQHTPHKHEAAPACIGNGLDHCNSGQGVHCGCNSQSDR